MTRLFVYGTLLAGEPNHALIAHCRCIASAATPATYALYSFGEHPGLVPTGRTSVVGEVYEVDDAALTRVDELEGHPHWYRRVVIELADGSTASTYVLTLAQVTGLPIIPSGSWASRR